MEVSGLQLPLQALRVSTTCQCRIFMILHHHQQQIGKLCQRWGDEERRLSSSGSRYRDLTTGQYYCMHISSQSSQWWEWSAALYIVSTTIFYLLRSTWLLLPAIISLMGFARGMGDTIFLHFQSGLCMIVTTGTIIKISNWSNQLVNLWGVFILLKVCLVSAPLEWPTNFWRVLNILSKWTLWYLGVIKLMD